MLLKKRINHFERKDHRCKMKSMICILSLIMASKPGIAQRSCAAAEFSQFDFWVGEWLLTWNENNEGTNIITKDLDGCLITEHFNDPLNKYTGMSWTVFNPNTNKWQQTWVDNSGDYITLTGGMKGNEIILQTGERKTANGIAFYQMVFYNIAANTFDWRWEASIDGGQTWEMKWKIHYRRKM